MAEESESGGWSYAFESEDNEEDTNAASLDAPEFKRSEAVMVLIDCTAQMFQPNEEGDVYFHNVIKLVSSFIKGKIISSPKDLMGIILYGTEHAHDNDNGFRHVHVFAPLDEPHAQQIQKVESLLRDEEFKKIGSANGTQVQFHQVLWTASNVLEQAGLKNFQKRVLVFTNNDDPNKGSLDQQTKALQKAKDLEELDIMIDLIGMDPPGLKFDARRFYKDIIQIDVDEDTGNLVLDFSSKKEELLKNFRKKETKKRALATCPFQLADGVSISVKLYCMIREAKKDQAVWLDAKTNDPLSTNTQWICEDTAIFLEEHQIKTYFPYGGIEVDMTKDEMKVIKDFGEPGLVLMGFKPSNKLKPYHNLKCPYFLYPDESKMKGSTVAFSALLTAMLESKKMAIARMIYRKGGLPRFVALLPQKEKFDADGRQEQPPGLHMVFLPFADDIRSLKFEPSAIADPEMIVKAKQIAQSLAIKPSFLQFENPSLQRHYAYLQALALDEQAPEFKAEDDTLEPDLEGMKKFDPLLEEFNEELKNVPEFDPSKAKKRKGGGGGGGGKRAKADEPDMSGTDWKTLCETGGISKLTIPQLKVYCRANKLGLAGKKADLIEKIKKHLGVE